MEDGWLAQLPRGAYPVRRRPSYAQARHRQAVRRRKAARNRRK